MPIMPTSTTILTCTTFLNTPRTYVRAKGINTTRVSWPPISSLKENISVTDFVYTSKTKTNFSLMANRWRKTSAINNMSSCTQTAFIDPVFLDFIQNSIFPHAQVIMPEFSVIIIIVVLPGDITEGECWILVESDAKLQTVFVTDYIMLPQAEFLKAQFQH